MNTQTMETLLITVGIEVVVALLLASAFFFFKSMKKKKADKAAAVELVETVTADEESRREGLLKVFGECYDMEEVELNAAVDEFLTRERAFYKTLISVYVERDSEKFAQLSGALESVVKPYSDLALSADARPDSSELDALQKQNQELSDELNESKQVMDELLSEYTASFDKELEGKAPSALEERDEPVNESIVDEEKSDIPVEEPTDLDLTLELSVEDLVEVKETAENEEVQEEVQEGESLNKQPDEAAVTDLVVDDIPTDLTVELSTEEQDSLSALEVEDSLLDEDVDLDDLDLIEGDTLNEVSLDEIDVELEVV